MKRAVLNVATLSVCLTALMICDGKSWAQSMRPVVAAAPSTAANADWSFVGAKFSALTLGGTKQWRLSSDSPREKLVRKIGSSTLAWYGARAKSDGGAVVFVTCSGASMPLQTSDSITTTNTRCLDSNLGGGNGGFSNTAATAISDSNLSWRDLTNSARAARVLQSASTKR